MSARLRILPVYGGERGRHYLILDRVDAVTQEEVDGFARRLKGSDPLATAVVYPGELEVPALEDDAEPDTYVLTLNRSASDLVTAEAVHRALRTYGRVSVRYA